MRRTWSILTVIGLFALCLACPAMAAEKFPTKPISLTVNFGGGGGTDTSARILAKAAEKHLGFPISVSNKPGGLGTTGVVDLKTKRPDGYSIGVATYAPLAIIPHQMQLPYTPADFDYILAYAQYMYGIFVNANSPIKTLDDLVAAAKAKEGGLTYAASGYPQPFAMQRISQIGDVTFTHMPVKSGSELNVQLLGGHVDVACAIMGDVLPLFKSGEIRILGTLTDERMAATPDIPTCKEQGYDVTLYSYMAIAAPKGVPAERLEILRKAFAEAHKDPEFQDVMVRLNIPAVYMSGEEFKERVEAGYNDARRDLKAMGMIQD